MSVKSCWRQGSVIWHWLEEDGRWETNHVSKVTRYLGWRAHAKLVDLAEFLIKLEFTRMRTDDSRRNFRTLDKIWHLINVKSKVFYKSLTWDCSASKNSEMSIINSKTLCVCNGTAVIIGKLLILINLNIFSGVEYGTYCHMHAWFPLEYQKEPSWRRVRIDRRVNNSSNQ
jgi:hypothetical protein